MPLALLRREKRGRRHRFLCVHDLEICAESDAELASAVRSVIAAVIGKERLQFVERVAETRRPDQEVIRQ